MKKLQFNPKNETEKLLQDNYGLIVTQAIYFKPKNNHILEEFIQVGVLSFLKAASGFNPDKGKFSTYISNCIHNAIYDFVKKNNKQIHTKLDDMEYVRDIRENIDDYLPQSLTDKEKAIVSLKLHNYSKKEIMEILDIEASVLDSTLKQIKYKIKSANIGPYED